MPPLRPLLATLLTTLPGTLALLVAGSAMAQDGVASRITQVTVSPGSATVERTARVAAGARSAVFRCLPASIDTASLQIAAGAGVRVGEFKITTEDRDVAAGCASPLDGRIQDLEDQLAAVRAETSSLQLVNRYLQGVAGNAGGSADTTPTERRAPAGTAPVAVSPAQIGATADALRKTSLDALNRSHALKRRQEALELALKPLVAERNRNAGGPRARAVSVAVNLAAEREGELRLSYQVRGPGWQPSYRAVLNSDTGAVVLERLALVAQNSGEDWTDVRLTLSTQAAARVTRGPAPGSWTLDVAPPPQPEPQRSMARLAAPPAPAAPAPMAEAAEAADVPSFDVTAFSGNYAMQFAVPQRITVPSNGQRTTLALGTHNASATLLTRAVPARQETAYLVAEIAPPPGAWPAGPVGLYRDGAFVGNDTLDFGQASTAGGKATLWFGADDQVIVQAEPEQENTGSAGFTGARTERRTTRAYRLENRHAQPVTLQVLDVAPVSRNEKIEVESRYTPTPQDTAWNRTPGTIAWQQPLAAGATARFTATHTVRYPKEIELREHQ
ncbi:DUF4139 domain-containing protein [Acidovorax sp. SUPP3334]|uniref:DUF4139 domain-containing protein n=1 Tax=Acidovorax sp. SUPP3334 TaxID=2920881 RepID=UPI0024E0D089|nr:DUF4139 domain-containing protein [Acidovorax sp. SUPP3334]